VKRGRWLFWSMAFRVLFAQNQLGCRWVAKRTDTRTGDAAVIPGYLTLLGRVEAIRASSRWLGVALGLHGLLRLLRPQTDTSPITE
jgi:hypothetical protein